MNQNFKLTIEVYGIKATVELDHKDVTIEEAFSAFKGAMISVGFSEELFNNYLKD